MVSSANTATLRASTSPLQPVARFAWLTLAYNIFVILWGAYVRATGSGAGCGNRWPLCSGDGLSKTPQAQTVIEFMHRATSGLALVMVMVLLFWCWRRTSKGDWPRYTALCAVILMFNEALLGALLVVFEHVGQDRSAGRAAFLCLHFGNTLLLLASLTLTAQWLSSTDRRFTMTRKPLEWTSVGLGLVSVMAIGITGSLAALGDTVFPATSLRASLAQDFSPNGHLLLRWRVLHPISAIVGTVYVLWVVLELSRKRDHSPRTLPLLTATLTVQIALGVMNVLLLAPVWVQIMHLLVADLFWILLVLASAELVLEPTFLHRRARLIRA